MLVNFANHFPKALYGGLTSNSNSLTSFLWNDFLGQNQVPGPGNAPGWESADYMATVGRVTSMQRRITPLSLAALSVRSAFVLTIGILTREVNGQQTDLLRSLNSQGLSLVETGEQGRMRMLRFLKPSFVPRELPDLSAVVGVSGAGDKLLIFKKVDHSRARELEVTTLDGEAVITVHPVLRGMTVLFAELAPDRDVIAFVGNFCKPSEKASPFGLHLLSVSGGIRTLVGTTEAKQPSSIGWSKDSKVIVYDTTNRIMLYNLESAESTFLAAGSHPTWSPDGRWIAYSRPDGRAALVSPDGSESKTILDEVKLGGGLRWSPDSRYLLYTDSKAFEIRVLELDSGRSATVFTPLDQYNETRLRWVQSSPH